MRHLELASYFDRADFKSADITWTLDLHFVEAYGGGNGYQFTADFVASPPEQSVTNVTVCVPDSEAFPRDDVLSAIHRDLASGALRSDGTVTYQPRELDA